MVKREQGGGAAPGGVSVGRSGTLIEKIRHSTTSGYTAHSNEVFSSICSMVVRPSRTFFNPS